MEKEEMLTREEAEEEICELIRKIHAVHRRYNPNANYLEMSTLDGHISVNNKYWSDDNGYPIQFFTEVKE